MNELSDIDQPRNGKEYQNYRCANMSDADILLGIAQSIPCNAPHHKYDNDHLIYDLCVLFKYRNGNNDHYNLRWLSEWSKDNRPNLLNRLNKINKLLILK